MIIYFSATNTTKYIAKQIQKATHDTLYEIIPEIPYTSNDLNWRIDDSRANQEQGNVSSRPLIQNTIPDLSNESVIYLGFPLWWGIAPRVINTFIEKAHLDGKRIFVFCTSGSSSVEGACRELKRQYPNINWELPKRFESDDNLITIQKWIEKTQK